MNKIIYKAVNSSTGEVYIGATSKTLEDRKVDHLQKANLETGHYFQEAIRTYGPEAFSWEQIDTATDPNNLADKESRYILIYNSNKEGYNSDRGGGIKKNIYQYDCGTGNLIQFYSSLESAGNAVNADKTTISKACLGQIKVCKGYFWSYSLGVNFKPDPDRRTKQVFQFAQSGEHINYYNSVSKASEASGINKSSIAKCCRAIYNSAGGYHWRYQDE